MSAENPSKGEMLATAYATADKDRIVQLEADVARLTQERAQQYAMLSTQRDMLAFVIKEAKEALAEGRDVGTVLLNMSPEMYIREARERWLAEHGIREI